MTDATDPTDGDQTVSLFVILPARIDLEQARVAFAEMAWLGRPVEPPPAEGWRRVATDLELAVRDGSGPAVRKAALLDVGPGRSVGEQLLIPIAWRSATFTPLFPVFAGHLEIDRTGLTLIGDYAPPFGALGLLIDRSLLQFVARRTGQAFLARVAAMTGRLGDDHRV